MMGAINSAVEGRMSFGTVPGVPPGVLSVAQMYATDGLAALIVDRPAEDALSRGFVVEGDEDETVLNEIDRLDAIQVLTDGLRWSRLHGAAAVLLLADDGLSLDQPLNVARLRRINDLKPYVASALSAGRERYTDPNQINYGEPTLYRIQPRQGQSFEVHETRLLRLSGEPVPDDALLAPEISWMGRSALVGCEGDLTRYRDALGLTRAILERKQQPVHQMEGLAETLALPDGVGERIVADRLRVVDMTRGVFTTIAVDGKDKYSVLDASVSGIDALLNGFRIALSASSGIPVPILFGEGLSGLGNSGSGEQGIYHGRVRQVQERSLRPALERLVSLIWAQSEVRAREPEGWRITFNPLWSPSEKEVADAENVRATARKTSIEALTALLDRQVVMADEGRKFVAATWPEYQVGDGPALNTLPDDDEPPEA
jgi:phage-related protein (TIGR01555 family)